MTYLEEIEGCWVRALQEYGDSREAIIYNLNPKANRMGKHGTQNGLLIFWGDPKHQVYGQWGACSSLYSLKEPTSNGSCAILIMSERDPCILWPSKGVNFKLFLSNPNYQWNKSDCPESPSEYNISWACGGHTWSIPFISSQSPACESWKLNSTNDLLIPNLCTPIPAVHFLSLSWRHIKFIDFPQPCSASLSGQQLP